jgi:hypothetical protein
MVWWEWQDQWRRVEIGLPRIEAVYEGRSPPDSDEARYDLYSFFLNCHHLRDWLAADDKSGMDEEEARAVVNGSQPLRVCRDLANRTKHPEDKFDKKTAPVQQNVTVFVGEEKASNSWKIVAPDATYDALDLARDCVTEWHRVLTDRQLV